MLKSSLLTLLACLLCAGASKPVLVGMVTRVVDGDTLVVQLSTGPVRVRLYGIDAPEHNQPGGREATMELRSLVDRSRVELEPVSQDRYNRMVAHIFRGALDVNTQMVRKGDAWVYRHYLARRDRGWCALESEARANHRGLWRDSRPVPPWDFRHRTYGAGIPPCP